MIPQYSIQEWSEQVPWNTDAMVEQDLIICRALVSIFSDKFLASQLSFRGGTALHKLYLHPQPRYSEDIDLVQITPGPIKPIMFRLGEVLDWLPNRSTAQKKHSNKMFFRFDSEIPPIQQLRLKIEINCFEHFNVLGLVKVPFKVTNSWFSGETELTTYQFEELMGTKLRALYQRKKGRDLFDIYKGLTFRECDRGKILECYQKYMEFVVERVPSYKEYVLNMQEKMKDIEFLTDVAHLLHPDVAFNPQEAYRLVYNKLIDKMDGKRE
ncbi:MAG: nucleotidyl transferase AbiEii/AbiGii toxin family protein [Bacteroidales bacterium]|nr:nucleotidyl transferase AbiEii/AbiGii toxin family protein [Bacteroidales bacterium]